MKNKEIERDSLTENGEIEEWKKYRLVRNAPFDEYQEFDKISLEQDISELKHILKFSEVIKVRPSKLLNLNTDSNEDVLVTYYRDNKVPIILKESDFIPPNMRNKFDKRDYLIHHLGGEYEIVLSQVDDTFAYGSRIEAMKRAQKLYYFTDLYSQKYKEGCVVTARITSVFAKSLIVDVGGVEAHISPSSVSICPLPNLNKLFFVGELILVFINRLKLNEVNQTVVEIQVSKTKADERNFTINLKNYQKGMVVVGEVVRCLDEGVIVYLENGISLFASVPSESVRPKLDDRVIVEISHLNEKKKRIYGKIISKSFLSPHI